MRFLLKFMLLGTGLILLILLLLSFSMPASWNVSVNVTSKREPEDLWNKLSDFNQWSEWSSWDEEQYGVPHFVFEGEPASIGHSSTWKSKNSRGKLVISDVQKTILPGRGGFERSFRYISSIESDDPNGNGEITLSFGPNRRTEIQWVDRGTLPIGTGLLAWMLEAALEAKFEEDLQRLAHGTELKKSR
ncbi:SRPBCC family protein [Planctomycetota bacterium]|nr:SRPBCC family protein [Planctomycetota bacterium]